MNRFSLNYAPHLGLNAPDTGMFRAHAGPNLVDQIRFAHAQGFRAIEDNFLKSRPTDTQDQIADTLRDLEMQMGVFVATFSTASPMHGRYEPNQPSFVSAERHHVDTILKEIRESAELASRVGAKWVTVLSGGEDPRIERGYQTAQMVETLRIAAPTAADAGVTLGLEPINRRDWPGTFMHTIAQGYEIVRAVDHPAVKLLFDVYHTQVETGRILDQLDQVWDEVVYMQFADNPGRTGPGTGEINAERLFAHLKRRGFEGVIGIEHDQAEPGLPGERLILESYRALERQIEGEAR
ncbi:MAG: TIM barrel protein [Myxococcota bacterium]